MSTILLLPEFIGDVQRQNDANFARRVFQKLFDADGTFRDDANDHRYLGIPNAWIRYISRGNTAFRVIYVREGAKVLVYRAGPHSIEDNLAPPKQLDSPVTVVGGAPTGASDPQARRTKQTATVSEGRSSGVISSLRTPTLLQMILARRLVPHREVAFVSPFLSCGLLSRNARLGRLVDDFIEDGARVILITRPPDPADLEVFYDLESRGVELHFHRRLHAKLYAFTVDPNRRVPYRTHPTDLYVLGSANMTESGLAGERETGNEELSYILHPNDKEDVESFLAHLALKSLDLVALRIEAARIGKRS